MIIQGTGSFVNEKCPSEKPSKHCVSFVFMRSEGHPENDFRMPLFCPLFLNYCSVFLLFFELPFDERCPRFRKAEIVYK